MNKLRHSLMRSRTPTGAEMKHQNSLEVPVPQVRSASFDEVQYKGRPRDPCHLMGTATKAMRPPHAGEGGGSSGVSVIGSQGTSLEVPGSSSTSSSFLLKVPYLVPKRSKSFDSGCGEDEDGGEVHPKRGMRTPSYDRAAHCIHCAYLEIIEKRRSSRLTFAFSDKSTSKEDDEADWENSSDDLNAVMGGIKVTLSPNSPSATSPTHEDDIAAPTLPRICRANSPKLERQPAIYCMPSMPADLSSQENSVDFSDGVESYHGSIGYLGSSSEYGDAESCAANFGDTENVSDVSSHVTYTGDVFLNVPTKLDRAVSLDMAFSSSYPTSFADSRGRQAQHSGSGIPRSISLEPPQALRSKSIDIELPTDSDDDYKVFLTASQTTKKAINSEVEICCEGGERRVIRATCDWQATAVNGDHLWCPTSASGDFCYVGEESCCKNGARLKCSACKIVAHTHCVPTLLEGVKFTCKPTFRDVGLRQYREHTTTHHHWVHRRNQKGKCKACNKVNLSEGKEKLGQGVYGLGKARPDGGEIEARPLLQAGGHGTCLTQCTRARIVTTKTIPMQVDGEACRVNPAIIEISHLNKAPMVTKMKAKASG
ncbi:hypothetical protein HAZT_HAZT004365 [Hyalella azteca]|uniref:Phorbol-ester/DAG-type domain-containing protein n=1 Tax=Hyalella azteca TaxID=294128 RepID=A0A6A0H1P4_HYAAZ|nr:hypothetical protein HAZT_HAZT004365 [Hyalella azteca]